MTNTQRRVIVTPVLPTERVKDAVPDEAAGAVTERVDGNLESAIEQETLRRASQRRGTPG